MVAAVLPLILGIIDKIVPDANAAAAAKLQALELAQKGELAYLEADTKIAQAQAATNQVEAGTDRFRGGWRPMCGWVCAAALAYDFLLRPLLPWLVAVIFRTEVPALPWIDQESLMVLLTGMLGLGGFRSWEKLKGKA